MSPHQSMSYRCDQYCLGHCPPPIKSLSPGWSYHYDHEGEYWYTYTPACDPSVQDGPRHWNWVDWTNIEKPGAQWLNRERMKYLSKREKRIRKDSERRERNQRPWKKEGGQPRKLSREECNGRRTMNTAEQTIGAWHHIEQMRHIIRSKIHDEFYRIELKSIEERRIPSHTTPTAQTTQSHNRSIQPPTPLRCPKPIRHHEILGQLKPTQKAQKQPQPSSTIFRLGTTIPPPVLI
jgi:hypothetical protein